jgi:(S)-2-hydroxyglutarate dehydrogenase
VPDARFDVVVVGAGILGLATARELLARHPELGVAVLDKEHRIGAHQTGHASGVVHRGVYYPPGSHKARLCVEGAELLLRYCDERGIPVLRCGKVVVATSTAEVGRLQELHRRSLANGVPRVELIGPERLREIEPHVAGVRALHSPETVVVDFSAVAAAYADDVRAGGGEILLGHEVQALRTLHHTGASSEAPARVVLDTSGGEVEARRVVVCAGLHADRVAALSGAPGEPRLVPFRGRYVRLRPERRHLARGLVYPVPDPAFPFLGIHTTVRPDGDVWLGPNAVLALAREGYRRRDASLRDVGETLRSRGFRRLARRHWRVGAAETVRDVSTRLFVAQARRLIPSLEIGDVLPGPSGVRAQAIGPDGSLLDDFVFNESNRVVHVRNAPSPGATSSLAIARVIADRVDAV